jgi:hypothetical protein
MFKDVLPMTVNQEASSPTLHRLNQWCPMLEVWTQNKAHNKISLLIERLDFRRILYVFANIVYWCFPKAFSHKKRKIDYQAKKA